MAQESTNVPPEKASFMAAISGLVPAASGTDIFTITGKSGRAVRINQIQISGIATAAAAIPISIVKRSTANTGGTSTVVAAVGMDTAANSAAGASVLAYTVNPGALGTVVGTVSTARMILSTASASVGTSPIVFAFERMYMKSPTLRDATESLCISYGGATAAGNSLDISISWTEEQV